MRILHVIVGLGVGGAERSLVKLIRAHHEDGRYEHHVVTLTKGGDLREDIARYGASLTQLELTGLRSVVRVFAQLIRLIRELAPNVVHCWMYHSDLLGGIAARICGVKMILWSIRNAHLEGNSKLKPVLRKTCALLSWMVPTKVICVAEEACRVHAQVGYAKEKMVVIPNGYDLDEFKFSEEGRTRVRRELGFTQNDLLVGSIGRFSPAKDHENFVRAASVAARMDQRLKFLMIGRGVNEDPSLQHKLSMLPPGRVVVLGQRNDVADCLSAVDIFCLHSITEGFPNVLAEAMAAERACIATDAGDSRIMLDGLGPIVPSRDSEALANAILKVASLTREEREAKGLLLRQRVQSRYSMESVVAQYERLYASVQ